MTPRPLARMRRTAAASLLLAAGLLIVAGCDPRPYFYFLQPFEPTVAPPFKGSFEKKRVVVLTHAVSGTQNDFLSLDRDLAREFGRLLREKVKKIDLVDQDKVWDWVEGHPNWTDPADAAKAFEADMVIFLEIESFQIQDPHSPGLLEGTARTHMQAVELDYPKNSKGKPITRPAQGVEDHLRRLPRHASSPSAARSRKGPASAGGPSRTSSSRSSPPRSPGTSSSTRPKTTSRTAGSTTAKGSGSNPARGRPCPLRPPPAPRPGAAGGRANVPVECGQPAHTHPKVRIVKERKSE